MDARGQDPTTRKLREALRGAESRLRSFAVTESPVLEEAIPVAVDLLATVKLGTVEYPQDLLLAADLTGQGIVLSIILGREERCAGSVEHVF